MSVHRNVRFVLSCMGLCVWMACAAPSVATAQTNGTWTNTSGGTWNTGANWSGGAIASGTGASANFATLNISATRTVTLDAAYTLGSLLFGDTSTSSSGSWVISNGGNAANTLTLDADAGTPTITVSSMGSGNATIGAWISGTQGLVVNAAGDTNAGLLVLSGSNNYTGNTVVNSGTLHFSTFESWGALSGTFSVSNATLLVTTAASSSNWVNPIVASGTGITIGSGEGSNRINWNSVISGTVGTVRFTAGTYGIGGLNTYSGNTVLSSSVNIILSATGATGSGGAPISGAFGTGTVTLAGGNLRTFSTTTDVVINNVVRVQANTAFAGGGNTNSAVVLAGPITLVGATRTFTLSSTGNVIAFTGSIGDDGNGYGMIVGAGSRLLILGGSNTFSGATTLSSGTLRLDNQHALQNSTFTHSGTGTLVFNSSVAGNAFTFGGLAASSTAASVLLRNNASTPAAITLTVGGNNENTSYAGSLTGLGSLVKTGAGKLTLSGNNSYAGATTVSNGILAVNGNQTSAVGVVSVAAGATLMGSGTIGGATTIAGLHSPGNSPGIQTFASGLTYSGGSSAVLWELAANTVSNSPVSFDQIVVGGNLDFAAATTLSLAFDSAGSTVNWADAYWDTGRTWTLYSVTGETTNFGNLELDGSPGSWLDTQSTPQSLATARPGAAFSLVQDGDDVAIVYAIVPEPAAVALAGIGIVAGIAIWARRRAKASPAMPPG